MVTTVATSQNVNGIIYNLDFTSSSDILIVPGGVNLVELGASPAVLLGTNDSVTVGGDIYGAAGIAINGIGTSTVRVLASGQVSSDVTAVNFGGFAGVVSNAGLISGATGIFQVTGQTLTGLRLNNSGSIVASGFRAVQGSTASTIVNTGVISANESNSGSAQAITLSGGDSSADIHNGGSIISAGTAISIGASTSSFDQRIYNSGLVQGALYALSVSSNLLLQNYGRMDGAIIVNGASTDIRNGADGTLKSVIANFGTVNVSISNAGQISEGLSINAGTLSLENSGAIGERVSVASGAVYITNTGRLAGAVSTSGQTSVYNAGEIAEIDTFNAADVITNAGVILATVLLYGGNDLYDGAQGRVLGRVVGGGGDDRLIGGVNADLFYGDNALGDTTGGADFLSGGAGDDVLYGGFGADQLYGNQDDDVLYGNQDNDWMHGGQGDDVLYGGQGNDTLNGGKGDDVLVGNLGDERFEFTARGFGQDRITDFRGGGAGDVIFFSTDIFGDFAAVQAGATAVSNGTLLTDAAGDTLLLVGIAPGALSAGMFVFG